MVDETLAVHVHVLLFDLHARHRRHIADGTVARKVQRQPHGNRDVVGIRPVLNWNRALQLEQLLLCSVVEHVIVDMRSQRMNLMQKL